MQKVLMSLVMVAVAALALCGGGEAAVYKVGDSAGWTVLNTPNYTAWAVSKKFHVRDVLVFEYNKQYHNVMEVSKNDYRNCNVSSPIATYTTGKDSITLRHGGHYYFLCGVPGHCAIGQKVAIRIPKPSSAAPSQAPSAASGSSPSPSTTPGNGTTPAPTPSTPPSGNAPAATAQNALALVAALAAVSAGFIMH